MLAFIEGSMERQFVNANFKYVHVIPVSNGISWTREAMCKQICSSYKAIDVNEDVVVWIDLEGRACLAAQLRQDIIDALCDAGADKDKVHVLVTDRMSENIMLADEHMMRSFLNDPDYEYKFEGSNGKSVMKRVFQAKGLTYKETLHGISLLKKLRLARSAEKSASVQLFLSTMSYDCWWINQAD